MKKAAVGTFATTLAKFDEMVRRGLKPSFPDIDDSVWPRPAFFIERLAKMAKAI